MSNPNVGNFKVNDLVEGNRATMIRDGRRGFVTSVENPSRDGLHPIAVRWHDGSSSSEWCGSIVKLVCAESTERFVSASKRALLNVQQEIDELSKKLEEKIEQREVLEEGILRSLNEG
jgi:hypothetical protein